MTSAELFGEECRALLDDLGDSSYSRGVVRYWKLEELVSLTRKEILRVYREAG